MQGKESCATKIHMHWVGSVERLVLLDMFCIIAIVGREPPYYLLHRFAPSFFLFLFFFFFGT